MDDTYQVQVVSSISDEQRRAASSVPVPETVSDEIARKLETLAQTLHEAASRGIDDIMGDGRLARITGALHSAKELLNVPCVNEGTVTSFEEGSSPHVPL
ncbi:MAG: hypothetical protein R3D66_02165 [Alphaproteobacteria bacterium]